MVQISESKKIFSIGEKIQRGTFILLIHLRNPIKQTFGRYKKRRTVDIKKGYLIYLGWTQHPNGPRSLGSLLLRHSSRSDLKKNQKINPELRKFLSKIQLNFISIDKIKKLEFNIDRVLDQMESSLTGIGFERSNKFLFNSWHHKLNSMDEITSFDPDSGINPANGEGRFYRLNPLKVLETSSDLNKEVIEWWRDLHLRLQDNESKILMIN